MEETESTSCEQLQEKYKELKSVLDECQKTLVQEGFTSNEYREITRIVAEKKQVLEKLIEKEYFKRFPAVEQAQEIMKEQFIGPEAIKETFGFSPDVPEIPFSAEELRHAKELNQKLILYVDTKDNKPFTIEVMENILDNKTSTGDPLINPNSSFPEESPRFGWRLTTPAIIDSSKRKNYLEQIEVLIDYLKNTVFEGKTLPEPYQKAVTEFEKKKDKIADLMKDFPWSLIVVGPELAQLAINQHTRENAAEVIYRLAITERQHKKREIEKEYTWTNSVAIDGEFVFVGAFGSRGIYATGWECVDANSHRGVCFSRGV